MTFCVFAPFCQVPGDVAASPQCSLGSSFSAVSSLSTDTGHNSDGLSFSTLSRSLTSSCSLSLPASLVTSTSLLLGLLSLRLVVSIPIHVQCITDFVHELSQSVICPSATPSPLLLWTSSTFQDLCSVHHVETPASEYMDLFPPSIHGIFFQCVLLPSAHPLRVSGLVSPFLPRPLPFLHRGPRPPSCLTLFWRPPSNTLPLPSTSTRLANSALNSRGVLDDMPRLPPISPLCCAHTCGPPDFEPLNDGQMEWSPIHRSAQGSFSDNWVLQWVYRSCGSSASMQDIPALPAVSCSQSSTSAAIVFDRPTAFLPLLSILSPSRR